MCVCVCVRVCLSVNADRGCVTRRHSRHRYTVKRVVNYGRHTRHRCTVKRVVKYVRHTDIIGTGIQYVCLLCLRVYVYSKTCSKVCCGNTRILIYLYVDTIGTRIQYNV